MVSQMPGSQPGAARPAFHEWGGFDSTAPGEGITSRFAATVRAAGAAVAAVEGSTSVTYDELDRRSNQLARFMRDRAPGPLLAVAEVEMDLAVAGQPGLAEFVRREGEAPRIAIEVPAQQRPQAGARRQEAAPQLRRDEASLARPLVIRQQGLGVVTDKRPGLQTP